MTENLDFTIEQGTDFRKTFLVLDCSGEPIPLGTWAAMQVRIQVGASTALLTLTTDNGGLVVDGACGSIVAIITEDVTETLPGGVYVYDIKTLTAAGKAIRPFEGTVTISPEVTTITPPSPSPAPAPSPSPGDDFLLNDGTNLQLNDGSNLLLNQG